MKIILHTSDLSLATLMAIKSDLEKYAHLTIYKDAFTLLCREINTRNIVLPPRSIHEIKYP